MLYSERTPLSFDMGAGHFGVELFFIISGFVILMTIERLKTVRDFAIARVTRLMPAFLAALVLASVILIFWRMPPLNTPTFLQFIANLTMALGLFGQNVVDLPYWTLTYELVFYVFMAPALRFRLLGSIEWLGLLAMVVACIYRATVDIEHHRRTTIVLRAYYSNSFLIGIYLYRIQTLVFLDQISYPHCLVHVALGYQIIRFGVEQG